MPANFKQLHSAASDQSTRQIHLLLQLRQALVKLVHHALRLAHELLPARAGLDVALGLDGVELQHDGREDRLGELLVLESALRRVRRRRRHVLHALRHERRVEGRRDGVELRERRLRLRRCRRCRRRRPGVGLRARGRRRPRIGRRGTVQRVHVAGHGQVLCAACRVGEGRGRVGGGRGCCSGRTLGFALLLLVLALLARACQRVCVRAAGAVVVFVAVALRRPVDRGSGQTAEDLGGFFANEAQVAEELAVVVEFSAFVDHLQPIWVLNVQFFGGFFARISDREAAVVDAIGWEFKRVVRALVSEDEDVVVTGGTADWAARGVAAALWMSAGLVVCVLGGRLIGAPMSFSLGIFRGVVSWPGLWIFCTATKRRWEPPTPTHGGH